MIHEEICTYEVCKLAKEKGFPQDPDKNDHCLMYCLDGLRNIHPLAMWIVWEMEEYDHENLYAAPTQSLLQRWLREEKGVHIEIAHNPMYGGFMPFICKIVEGEEGVFTLLEKNCHCIAMRSATYEEALEAGLQYVLEHFEQWNIKEE